MRIIRLLSLFGIFVFVVFTGFLIYTFLKYDEYISSKDKLLNYKDEGIILLDRHNTPYYFFNNATLDEYVPLNDVSPHLSKAIIATEDENFYEHYGVSPKGILRSVMLNFQEGRFAYGGSTLTQQLVKNTLLSPQRVLTRKAQEAVLALSIESKYTKDEILEMYINTVYYGEGSIGVKSASKTYFNKDPKNLTIAESAYLAGLLRYPSLYSPFSGNPELGKRSQEDVLEKMHEQGFLLEKEKEQAKKEFVKFVRGYDLAENEAPHFALMVLDRLKVQFGDDAVYEGYKVKTTLDLSLQKKVQQTVKTQVNNNLSNGVSNGAAVSLDPKTGDILALVGSADWFDERSGRVNMALKPRQPGSSFKPVVYSIAIDDGLITPATVLRDVPRTFVLDPNCRSEERCIYKPQNYDRKFRGRVTVRRALANSLNVPSVEVMERVGIYELTSRAPDFGITTLESPEYYGKGLSLGLGSAEVSPLEMATAYSTFANYGRRAEPRTILEVHDKFGKTVYENNVDYTDVISEEAAYLTSSILSDNSARSEQFGSILTTPFPAAVKTGTTENYRDAWTIGYTPNFVTAVWVGNSDARPIRNLPGSLAAAPIWKEIMRTYSQFYALEDFRRPSSIVRASYCDRTSSDSARIEYFVNGTEPSDDCARNSDTRDSIAGSDYDNLPQIGGDRPSLTPTILPTNPPQETVTPTPITPPQNTELDDIEEDLEEIRREIRESEDEDDND